MYLSLLVFEKELVKKGKKNFILKTNQDLSIYLSMSYKTARVSNVLLVVFFLNFRFMFFSS